MHSPTSPEGAGVRTAARAEKQSPPKIPDHELLRKIGGGSYGDVWLARNIMGSYRAVKLVYRSTFDDDRPYEREFRGIQKFEPISRSHPSQVSILHVGRGEGLFFYVMELADDISAQHSVPGSKEQHPTARNPDPCLEPATYAPKTLKSLLAEGKPLPYRESLEIITSLATALEHLHRNGLVHRDIKPSNIIFVNGIPKLADIGLVAHAGGEGSFVGTEGYVPPEGPGAPRADIFGLGKVLYEMITGFDRKRFPNLPAGWSSPTDAEGRLELNQVMLRACQGDQQMRYANAGQLRADLALLQAGRSVRRLRVLEQKARLAAILGTVALVLALLGVAGFVIQRKLATDSRRGLVQSLIEKGVAKLDARDAYGALGWFGAAFRLDADNPAYEEMHRLRLASALGQAPRLLQSWQHDSVVTYRVSDQGSFALAEFEGASVQCLSLTNGARVMTWTNALAPIRFAKNETTLASFQPGDTNGIVSWWDVSRSGWSIRTTNGSPVRMAAAAPASHCLVTVAQQTNGLAIKSWEFQTGQLVAQFSLPGRIQSLTVAPDGRSVGIIARAAATNTTLTATLLTLPGLGDPREFPVALSMPELMFCPDAQRVAIHGGGSARLRDLKSGREVDLGRSRNWTTNVNDLHFSLDGRHFVVASEHPVVDVYSTRNARQTLPGLRHRSPVISARFSPSGRRIVTATRGGTVHVWDAVSGLMIGSEVRHSLPIVAAAFSGDDEHVVSLGKDSILKYWDLRPNRAQVVPLGAHGEFSRIAVSRDRTRFIAMNGRNSAELWNLEGPSQLPDASRHDDEIRCVEWRADGKQFLTGSRDGIARLWNAFAPDREVASFVHGTNQRVVAAFFDHDIFTVSTSSRSRPNPETGRISFEAPATIHRWNEATASHTSKALTNTSEFAEFSPDGRWVITGRASRGGRSARGAYLWPTDLNSFCPIELAPNLLRPRLAAFSPNSLMVALADAASATEGHRGWLALWSVQGTEIVHLWHLAQVHAIAFSLDSRKLVAACNDGTARIWDTSDGTSLSQELRSSAGILDAAFSADGRFVACGSTDGSVRIWSVETGEFVCQTMFEAPVQQVSFVGTGSLQLVVSLAFQSGDISSPNQFLWRPKGATESLTELEDMVAVAVGAEIDRAGGWRPLENAELKRRIKNRASKIGD